MGVQESSCHVMISTSGSGDSSCDVRIAASGS